MNQFMSRHVCCLTISPVLAVLLIANAMAAEATPSAALKRWAILATEDVRHWSELQHLKTLWLADTASSRAGQVRIPGQLPKETRFFDSHLPRITRLPERLR